MGIVWNWLLLQAETLERGAMKKLSFLIVFLCGSAHAAGPIFQHKDKFVQQEFENSYQDLRSATSKIGVVDGSDALAGAIGEYKESLVATFTSIPSATGVWGDLASISLTAGDWDVTGSVVDAMGSGTTVMTFHQIAISTTSGNSSAGLSDGNNRMDMGGVPTVVYNTSKSIPNLRINQTSTKTVYLKYNATYSSTTPLYTCKILARRVR